MPLIEVLPLARRSLTAARAFFRLSAVLTAAPAIARSIHLRRSWLALIQFGALAVEFSSHASTRMATGPGGAAVAARCRHLRVFLIAHD